MLAHLKITLYMETNGLCDTHITGINFGVFQLKLVLLFLIDAVN